jgi:hypothetical protein
MTTGRLAVAALAVSLAIGSGIAALAGGAERTNVRPIDLDDRDGVVLRRDDVADEIAMVDDDDKDPTGDRDRTRGDDGTNGGDNTGDGDGTRGNDGTSGGNNTGDGDGTTGNDGTNGGDNTYSSGAVDATDGGGTDDSGTDDGGTD